MVHRKQYYLSLITISLLLPQDSIVFFIEKLSAHTNEKNNRLITVATVY